MSTYFRQAQTTNIEQRISNIEQQTERRSHRNKHEKDYINQYRRDIILYRRRRIRET